MIRGDTTKFCDPRADVAFRKLLTTQLDVTKLFLQSVLNKKVKEVRSADPHRFPAEYGDKMCIFDVKVVDSNQHLYIVEMQRKKHADLGKRLVSREKFTFLIK